MNAAVWGGVVAALGFLAKQIWDATIEHRRIKRARRSQLVELQALLSATRVSYEVQILHRNSLLELLRTRLPTIDVSRGYDQAFASVFTAMSSAERELHTLIRGISVYSLLPGNAALIAWFNDDKYFKAQAGKPGAEGMLALKLSEMQTHIILWQAKFNSWIPDQPWHALVYMDDENQHGSRFPSGMEDVVKKVLNVS